MECTSSESRVFSCLQPHFEAVQRAKNGEKLIQNHVAAIQQALTEDALASLSMSEKVPGSSRTDELASCLERFLDCAIFSMATAEKTSSVQESVGRVLELAAAVAAGDKATAECFLRRCLEGAKAALDSVRVVSCQGIGFLVKYIVQQHASGWDGLLEAASQGLLGRFVDKSQPVRKAALEAGPFFFMNDTTDLDVLNAMLYAMQHDPSSTNRVAACSNVPVNLQTLDFLVQRIRDVHVKVRVAALASLKNHVMQSGLSLMEPMHYAVLVETGYSERCAATKEATRDLVCGGWLRASKFEPLSLLSTMNIIDHEEACETMIRLVLETNDDMLREELEEAEIQALRKGMANSLRFIGLDNKSQDLPETLFFARVVCSTAKTDIEKENILAKVIPDITVLCTVLEENASRLVQAISQDAEAEEDRLVCICTQLLRLAANGDLEEGSRRHLKRVLTDMLSSILTPEALVEGGVLSLRSLYTHEADYLEDVNEILMSISTLEKLDDEMAINHALRLLSILSVVLEQLPLEQATSSIVADFPQYVLPAVTHSNIVLREAGVSCLGRLGLLSTTETIKFQFKPLLLQIASNVEEKQEVRGQALLALADWCFLVDEVDGVSDLVYSLFDDVSRPLACIAAEIAARFLYRGLVVDSKWLAQLVWIFFDPSLIPEDEEEQSLNVKELGNPFRLQQLLSIFFPTYCIKSARFQEAFVGCIGPLLDLSSRKKSKKQGSRGSRKTLPVAKMVTYICSSVDEARAAVEKLAEDQKEDDENIAASKGSSSTLLAAIQVAQVLSEQAESFGVTVTRALCRLIGNADLDIEREEAKQLSRLQGVIEELESILSDSASLQALEPLSQALAELPSDNDAEEEDTDGGEDSLVEAFGKVTVESPTHLEKENETSEMSAGKGRDSIASTRSRRSSLRELN